MDIGGLVSTFFNNAGPGGVVVLLIFGGALTIYYLLTRWIIAGGRDGIPTETEDQPLNTDV
ncbi:MAG: hypothetical protein WCC12_02080 [Anaerolineales bacterium]